MKDKKLQVFVSSTYIDLKEERQAAVEAILSSGNIPAGMELFAAGDESQMVVIERWIDESDAYLLILGGRYGSIDKNTGKSYTHLEYEYALKSGKPLFAVVINEDALDLKVKAQGKAMLEQEFPKELKVFRGVVLQNLVKFWDDKKDIKLAIHETLSEFSYTKKMVGWIRGDNAVNGAILAEEVARLTKENAELRNKIESTEGNTNALYANLTYNQLEQLLKREICIIKEQEITLFDYFLYIGKQLGRGYWKNEERAIIYRLISFKVIEEKNDPNMYAYVFTSEGHNFYLKALLLNPPTET